MRQLTSPGTCRDIETLAAGHWYGIPQTCTQRYGHLVSPWFKCSGDEAQQAPLYYLILAGWQSLLGLHIDAPYRGATNPALFFEHESPELLHDQAPDSTLLWLRFANLLLGALTIVIAFLATRLVTRDRWTPLIAAGIVAFVPRFVFLSAFVTNDNLVDLLGACPVYAALWYLLRPSVKRMVVIGVVAGLLVTTKLSALPVVLVILCLAAFGADWRRRILLVGVGSGTALVVSGWYLVQNTVRYGEPLAFGASSKYLAEIDALGTIGPYRVTAPFRLVFDEVPQRVVQSIWYSSGWGQYRWADGTPWVITFLLLALLLGLLGKHIRRDVLIVLAVLVVLSLLCVWFVAFGTATYEGRYAIVGLCAFAILLALALERWPVWIRFLVPVAGLIGTVYALQTDVLSVHWTEPSWASRAFDPKVARALSQVLLDGDHHSGLVVGDGLESFGCGNGYVSGFSSGFRGSI